MTLGTPVGLNAASGTERPDATTFRRLVAYLVGTSAQSGVIGINALKVSQRGAGANMSVDIASGPALTEHTEITTGGLLFVYNDATFNLTATAADPTNPRKDLVILHHRDSSISGGNDDAQFAYVAGTPAASPAEPNPVSLGFKNYQVLALVDVPAADTAITDAQITDRRRHVGAGLAVVRDTNGLPATPYEGQTVYDATDDGLKQYSGAAWGFVAGAQLISSQTLGAGAATVAFNSIPQTYEHLLLHWVARSDNATTSQAILARFNGDTAANYNSQLLTTATTTATAARNTGETSMRLGNIAAASAGANQGGIGTLIVPFYRNSTFFKLLQAHGGLWAPQMEDRLCGWQSTAAVSSITLLPGAGNFIAGSQFALYGMR